jgi:hypothetical protein
MSHDLPVFPSVHLYRLLLTLRDPIRLGEVPDSDLHGPLSEGLRDLLCIRTGPHARDCRSCAKLLPRLHTRCAFPPLFEPTATDPELIHAGVKTAPAPFILGVAPSANAGLSEDPVDLPAGATLALNLTLFGDTNTSLPHYIQALRLSGARGRLGPRDRDARTAPRARYTVERVFGLTASPGDLTSPDAGWWPAHAATAEMFADDAATHLDAPSLSRHYLAALTDQLASASHISLRLLTPLRLRVGKRPLESFDLNLILTRTRDRARLLSRLYSSAPTSPLPDTITTAGIRVDAHALSLSTRARSGGRPAHGLLGRVDLTATSPGAFAPVARLLALLPWLGCGQLASLGFGRVGLESVAP